MFHNCFVFDWLDQVFQDQVFWSCLCNCHCDTLIVCRCSKGQIAPSTADILTHDTTIQGLMWKAWHEVRVVELIGRFSSRVCLHPSITRCSSEGDSDGWGRRNCTGNWRIWWVPERDSVAELSNWSCIVAMDFIQGNNKHNRHLYWLCHGSLLTSHYSFEYAMKTFFLKDENIIF